MTLPTSYNTGTVTAKYTNLDGTAAAGKVTFTPRASRIVALSESTIVLPKTLTATLDVDGEISIVLPATNDPDISPLNFTYAVSEDITGGGGSKYDIEVLVGTTVDLSSVVGGAVGSAGSTIIRGPQGDPGDVTTAQMNTAIANAIAAIPSDGTSGTASLRTLGTTGNKAYPGTSGLALETGKEDAGVAADLVADLPELADGIGAKLNTATAGFVKVNRSAKSIAILSGITVTSTTTETAVFTTAMTWPSSDMTVDVSGFSFVAYGTHINNTGSSQNLVLKFKVNTDQLFAFTLAIPASASSRFWRFQTDFRLISFAGTRASGVGVVTVGAAGGGSGFDLGSMVSGPVATTLTLGANPVFNVTTTHATNGSTLSTVGIEYFGKRWEIG